MATRTADQLLAGHLGLRLAFQADPAFVADVRHAVGGIARALCAAEVAETLELLASELATNGIKALYALLELTAPATDTTPELSVTLIRFPGGVVLSCWDPYWQSIPTPEEAGPDDVSGRGLFLVDALADEWGVELDAAEDGTMRGKFVYVVLLVSDDSEPTTPTPLAPAMAPPAAIPRMRCDPAKVGFPQPSLRGVKVQCSSGFDTALGKRVLAGLGAL